MKTSFRLVLTVLACLAAPALARAEEPKTAKVAYSALEIARFDVNREDYSSKEAERAGKISDEFLDGIQRALLGEMTRSSLFPAVRKPAESAEAGSPVLILGGRIVDFKPGNRAARYFAGFGAGQQKIEVECVLKNKTTGEVVAKEMITDRKVAGWAGGSEEKGVEDFAEKVLAFLKRSIGAP